METDKYIPGVCNIGPVEIARRRTTGWIGIVITIIVWALFIVFHVAAPWRFFLFFPAAFAASGFIQAAMHFCSGFGMQGVFNFGDELYKTTSIEEKEFKAADRRKSFQIIGYSIIIGLIVTLIACFI